MRDLLVFSSDYPPSDGGIARLCSEIAAGYTRAGLDVQVIAPAPENGVVTGAPQLKEIRVRHSRPGREWASYRALRTRVGRGPVICGLWYPDGLLATAAAASPRVILAHGFEILPNKVRWRRQIWRRMMRSVCESADLVIANSEYTLEKLLESAPKAKAVAIPLGVNHEHFCPGDTGAAKRRFRVADKLVLSSVSRLEGYKGHDVVLRAIAACSECIRERLVYLIAGKGPHRGALEQQVVELGLSNQVRFLGFVPEENLPDLYRASDLFVICSREIIGNQDVEGFGLVFLEAQSCGTPVVGSRTGGIPDAVKDGHGGWLIAQDDSAMLARIVTSLAEDPERFRKAGQEARRRIELDCTWDKYMSRFASALKANGISVC